MEDEWVEYKVWWPFWVVICQHRASPLLPHSACVHGQNCRCAQRSVHCSIFLWWIMGGAACISNYGICEIPNSEEKQTWDIRKWSTMEPLKWSS